MTEATFVLLLVIWGVLLLPINLLTIMVIEEDNPFGIEQIKEKIEREEKLTKKEKRGYVLSMLLMSISISFPVLFIYLIYIGAEDLFHHIKKLAKVF